MPKRTLVAIVVTTIVLTPAAALAAPPYPIMDAKLIEERSGVREVGWTAWSELLGTRKVPAYIKPDDGARRRIPVARPAFVGGFQLSGPRAGQVVFWQYTRKLRGIIRFFDPVSGTIKRAPKNVNQKRWSQKFASISGNYLLFGRGKPNIGYQRGVFLYNFSTKKVSKLAGAKVPRFNADQVRGDYAVWTNCGKKRCHVFRQTISTGQRVRMPAAPAGRINRYGAVDTSGNVYYTESSGGQCGKAVKILKFDGVTVSTVLEFKDGVAAEDLHAWSDGGTTRITYTRSLCDTFRTGIWEVAA